MAKTLTNFRLSTEAIEALDRIAEHFGLSRTAAFEAVIREVARRDLVSFLSGPTITPPPPKRIASNAVEVEPGIIEIGESLRTDRRFCSHGSAIGLCKHGCKSAKSKE